jgi:P2 family phage contractile tail tube protein
MPYWPHRVSNYSVFKDEIDLIGLADCTLPNLTMLSEEFKGAGWMGSADIPTHCHFGPASLVLNWHVPDENTIELAVQDSVDLDIWCCHQGRDSGTNKAVYKGWRFFVSGIPKGLNLGTMEVSAAGAASTELEVMMIRGLYEDRELIYIDKDNWICKIKGVDYAAAIRQKIGRT